MAETKITIKGDSKDAVASLKAASAAVDNLTSEIADANSEAAKSSSGLDQMAASVSRTQVVATGAARSLQTATGAIGGFAGALSQISPAAGAAAGALGSISSAAGGLMSLLNPVSLGVAAVTLALGAGVKAWQASRDAQRAHNEAMRDSRDEMKRLQSQARDMASAMDDAAGRVGRVAGAYRAVAAELEAMNTQRTQFDSANLIAEEEQRVKRLEAALLDEGAAREALRVRISEQERVLARAAREQEVYNTRANRRQHEAAAAELARLNAELAVQSQRLAQASVAYGEAGQALDDLRLSMSRVGQTAGEAAQSTATSATSATRSVSELADAMLRAASASGDWSRVMSSLDGGGSMGKELARMLQGVDERLIQQLALPAERIQELYRESMSGAERLRAQESTLVAQLDARASAMAAIAEAEAEAQRVAYAREQLEVDSTTRQAQARIEQEAWYASVSMSTAEQVAAEEQLRDVALERLREGLILTQEQREAVEAHLDAQRAQVEELAKSKEDLHKALSEGAISIGLQSMVSLVGTLAQDLFAAAAAGESMGEAVPKAVLKTVGSMAAQFGALSASLALMSTFTPALQGNAAGLWAAAAGFAVIAAAAGVGANYIGGKRGKGASSAAATLQQGDRTQVYVEHARGRLDDGHRARDFGASRDSADRLYIDRGRSWA